MTTSTETGYAEGDFLVDPFATGLVQASSGFQALQTVRKNKPIGMQVKQTTHGDTPLGMQVDQTIRGNITMGAQALMRIYLTQEISMQANMLTESDDSIGQQASQTVVKRDALGMQTTQHILDSEDIGMESHQTSSGVPGTGMQSNQTVKQSGGIGMEAHQTRLRHAMLDYYLVEGGFGETPFAVDRYGAFLGMQATMIRVDSQEIGMQTEMRVFKGEPVGQQAKMTVFKNQEFGFQANMFTATKYGMQARMVIYNNTELRLMYEFPSRGVESLLGNNWSSTSTAPGDFSPNNLNTDVAEQVFRSQTTSFSIVCDTGIPQGVPLDTIAILNHNLTRGARVQVQGSNDNFATAPRITFNMTTELLNMFYVAKTFPTSEGQNRYWKFIIDDVLNPNGFVEIGIILFGPSKIFTVSESFINPLQQRLRHFKDSFSTEGFTNKSNDRALKRSIRLTFRQLEFLRGNYKMLEDMMKYARTSLKVLVIPTPLYPSRFAIFGKLTDLPEITHTSIDVMHEYIDFTLEFDEAL